VPKCGLASPTRGRQGRADENLEIAGVGSKNLYKKKQKSLSTGGERGICTWGGENNLLLPQATKILARSPDPAPPKRHFLI